MPKEKLIPFILATISFSITSLIGITWFSYFTNGLSKVFALWMKHYWFYYLILSIPFPVISVYFTTRIDE